MTDPIKFIAPRIAFTDPNTGELTRAGVLFLQGVFERVGGANGPSTGDLSASLFEDAGNGETNALLFTVDQTYGQLPPEVSVSAVDTLQAELAELRDQVAELKKDLDAIRQGTLI